MLSRYSNNHFVPHYYTFVHVLYSQSNPTVSTKLCNALYLDENIGTIAIDLALVLPVQLTQSVMFATF